MSLSLDLSVKSPDDLDLIENRHRIVSNVQDKPFVILSHVSLFFYLDIITHLSLDHPIEEFIDTLNITIEVGRGIGMID